VIKAIIFDYSGVFYTDRPNQELEVYARQLHSTYHLGLLTNLSARTLSNYLTQDMQSNLFDAVVTADTIRLKPHPDGYRLILEQLGVSATEVVFVDDSADNCDAARSIGMRAVQFMSTDDLKMNVNALLEQHA
jgi:HAD superfamily hydrolase (TIGR01509 family)